MNTFYKSILTLLLLFSTVSQSQLYVGPNSYVYANDRLLYIKQDINLQNTGNIYLRNNSQLLQATTGSSANQGAGKLSEFQEGTVNNYSYNYWCSPVGNASPSGGNEPFGITMFNRPTTTTSSTAAVILGTTALDGIASNLSIAPRWVYKFLSSSTYSQWITVGSASTIGAGEGFTMKGTGGTDGVFTDAGVTNNPGSAQRYDFRGKPNDGNITINVGAGKMTLTGNPYASAIDLQRFLTVGTNATAANCTGIAYFWEQDKTVNSHYIAAYQGGYGAYAAGTNTYVPPTFYAYDGAGTQLAAVGTGTSYPRRFSPIGQGFMIEGTANATVSMTNDFRVYQKEGGLSHFERGANNSYTAQSGFLPIIPSISGFDYTTMCTAENPQIRFNTLLNNQGVRQVALTFHPGATDGVDHAMDAKAGDLASTDMYFVLNNNEYVIAAVDFNINKRIPIGFKNTAAAANFKITVSEILNFTGAQNVFIHDKGNDTYHDIKNGVFEVTLPQGSNNSRFEITFVNELLNVVALPEDTFDVFQNNDTQILTVSNPKSMDIESVTLYDITGKLVFKKSGLGTESFYKFSTNGFAEGIYITKITTTDNRSVNKKISIFKS